MYIPTAEHLPGLIPFKTNQQSVFFGRQRQVDDLLSIIQSSRLIGLVGQAGSGKTSLIRAGLIPALESGFDGMVGKKWAIAYCRTGVTPIENLAAALAEENVLVASGKGSLELQQEIVREMRRDHSGLLRAVAQKETLHQKNLLIILDQFEDIFQFEDLSKERNEQWDLDISLLFNNLARAVASNKSPIYVLIGLRSSFLPKMYNFRSIQDYLNAGLYALPLLRQDDLKQIIQTGLKQNGLLINNEAFSFLEKGYNQNAHNLPFVQLSIQKLVQKRLAAYKQYIKDNENNDGPLLGFPEESVEIKHVANDGDITMGVAHALEKFYEEQIAHDKVLMQQLFKMITRPGAIPDIRQPRTFKEILDVTEVPRADVKNFLIKLHKEIPTVIEFVQPYIHNTDYFHEDSLRDDTIINISNAYTVHPWNRLRDWILEERESRETYLRLTERALLFEQGKAGYLVPPDLDVILQWHSKEQPKKVWADQFNSLFDLSIEYLFKSKEEHQLALERKEIERKREIKRIKRFLSIALFGLLIAIGGICWAWIEKNKATKEQEIAQNEANKAQIQKKIAEKAGKAASAAAFQAEKEREIAKQNEQEAIRQKKVAFEATTVAIKNEKEAKDLTVKLNDQIEEVKKSKKAAEDNATEALRNKEEALKNADLANNTRDFIDSRSRVITLLNRLNSESFLSPESRMSFVDSLIANYDHYVSASKKLTSDKVPPFNDLYRVLTNVDWKILDNKSSLFNSDRNIFSTESGLRNIDILDSKLAVAAGDDQRIVFFKPGTKPEIFDTKVNNSRIRSIKFIDETSVVFSNLNGELFLFNKTGKIPAERERKIATLDDNIISTIVLYNDQVITLNKGALTKIAIKTGAKQVMKAPTGLIQLFELADKRLILKTTTQLLVYDVKTETATPLVLPVDMPALKISSVALSSKYSFWGTDEGKIYVCNPLTSNTLTLVKTLKPHKTKITSLLVDNEAQQLITSSMDNTSKIYTISYADFKNWEETVLTLEGFKKWIWDLGLISSEGRTELLTVDEGGELLRWSTRMEDLYKDVKSWKNKNSKK